MSVLTYSGEELASKHVYDAGGTEWGLHNYFARMLFYYFTNDSAYGPG
ncbi:MAG: hypothetical protein JRJ06_05490 [Deltaproteobacteria bacterium]|nr:hypothetical protein [Deltaproteobacteria bacterium]